ncbi:hypothetical protein ACROYT_G034943 [Oculina patagonica]
MKKFKKDVFFILASTVGSVSNGCARLTLGDRSNPNPTIPQATWYQTPTVVNMGNGHYRALGRVIHLKKLKQQLESQKQLNFHAVRSTMNVVQRVDILAEAVYVEGTVSLRGINSVKIYAREIVASTGSKIDFSAPNWNQFYRRGVSPGSNGENGKHGLGGPRVDISCDVITGSLEVISNGGNGHKGQRGGDGNNKADSGHTVRTFVFTRHYRYCYHHYYLYQHHHHFYQEQQHYHYHHHHHSH